MILEVRMQRNEIRLITVQDDANVHDVRLKIEEICSICLDDLSSAIQDYSIGKNQHLI